MTRSKFVTTLSSMAIAGCALAPLTSDAKDSTIVFENELDEIIVSAIRSDSAIRNIARSISVVDKDDIQIGRQQLALDEALAGVPGLYMQNRYNFAQDLRVSLRGFGARSAFGIRGIKVIVDGIPVTLPDGQSGVDSIDLGSTRRIEVLRGPSSTLYGNASGGVIAIESERGTDMPFVTGALAGGNYGYKKYQLKAGGQPGRISYLVNVTRQEIDGYRDHSRAESTLLNTRFDFQLAELDTLTLTLNHADQPVARDPGAVTLAQVLSNPRSARDANLRFDVGEALDQQRLGLVYETDRMGGNLQVRNYYVWRDFANKLPFVGAGSVDLERFFHGVGAQYRFDSQLPDELELTAGIDIERQDDERRRFDNLYGSLGQLAFEQDEMVDSNGVYLHGNYRANDGWGLSVGLRYDEISFNVIDRFLSDGDDSGRIRFGSLSPYVGIHVDIDSGMLFASYSSSFETPTTTELANPDGSGGFNRSLKPQQAENFEVGLKVGTDGRYLELAIFNIDLKDELVPFEQASSPGRAFFANAGRSSRTGIEIAYSWAGKAGFGIDVSYSLSDFVFDNFVDENGSDFSGNILPGVPEQFGSLALSYQNEHGLNVGFENFFSGRLFADNANDVGVSGYLVSSVRVSQNIDRGKWHCRPYLGINNLFDEDYNSNIRINAFGGRYFEPAPDRNIYAGISVRYQ